MDLRLQLLDSFNAQGSDGVEYTVRAYDRLVPNLALADGLDRWESSGEVEYRLADGRLLDLAHDGTARVHGTEIVLDLPEKAAPGGR